MTERDRNFWFDLRRRFEALDAGSLPVWAKRMPDRTWVLGGGRDKQTRELIKALCVQAAIAAALDGDPLTAWLDSLTRTVHHRADVQPPERGASLEYVDLENVTAASVLAVTQYESESMRGTVVPASFPNRAQWVKTRMVELSIESPWAVETKHGGPDKSSVQKVLDGQPVAEKTLRRLASALQTTREEIPNN